jgi:hypothetical protein
MRRFALSTLLTLALFVVTAVSVFADGTGPGI